MRKILLLLFTMGISLSIHAQVLPGINKNDPVYYLDHVRLKAIPVFSVDQIDSIKVAGDHAHGKIYVKTRNPKALHFMTLSQVAKRQGLSKKLLIFMLDGKFLQDTTGMRIDSSYILRTVLIPSSDFKYLDQTSPFTIINILTKSKENLNKEKQVYIRGIETTSVKN